MLCECSFFPFLGTSHWFVDSVDLGHHRTSYFELLILFEQWVGHLLFSEKVVRPHERVHRPISISPTPVTEGIEIRQGCRFISCLIRALGKLLGGMGGFLPCAVGRHFSWLR